MKKQAHRFILENPITYSCLYCKKQIQRFGNEKQRKLSELNQEKCP